MPQHDEFDDFFGDEEETTHDTRADGRLYRVPVTRLAPNLVNPRTDFGTRDQLIDLGKSLARRQNQPCPAVSRAAYLKLWPDHTDRIDDVDYVLVSGERRYRAATEVGLASLDCVVNDAFADSRKTFMEAVVSENVDRQNFDPVEEAYAVHALVTEFGSNRAVAQHFERVDGWVTQRVSLTYLAPALQSMVREKKIPLEAARKLGSLVKDKGWPTEEQLAWWERESTERARLAAERKAAKAARKTAEASRRGSGPTSFTAVKPADGPAPSEPETPSDLGTPESGATPPTPPRLPAGRTSSPVPEQAAPNPMQGTGTHETGTPPEPKPEPGREPQLGDRAQRAFDIFTTMSKEERVVFLAHCARVLRQSGELSPDIRIGSEA
ncbi:ParB/RepB/Spo0J family partition protein [Streptomyces fradiae]|uniref:ParB/RepB/Spo0J family partition protein n=1 Tax=Streptomyces fradiae TaxID=1906 RepID=UPI0036FCF3BE